MALLEVSKVRSNIAETFARNGFAAPITVMTTSEAENYRRQLENAEATHAHDKKFRQCLRRYPNLRLPFIDEITRRPEITDVIAEILGPDLLALDSPLFIKEANTNDFVSWHQDLHYWGLRTDEEVTAWVALSPATTQSGCMRFVPGSQNNKVEHHETFNDENLLSRGQEVAVDVDESEAIEAELRSGQMSIHHGHVFHASHPNRSNDRRIGIAIRYIPTRAKQARGGKMAAMLVRGKDRYNNFRHCNRPTGLMHGADVAHWVDISDARNSVITQ